MSLDPYICDVSGVSAPGTEDDGDNEGIPLGWTVINLSTRIENPEWVTMMQAREAVVTQQLAQVEEADREKSRPLAVILARASFAALEQMTPRYVSEDRQVYVSAEQLAGVLKALGQDDDE